MSNVEEKGKNGGDLMVLDLRGVCVWERAIDERYMKWAGGGGGWGG